jgi:hypothetical protein
MIHLAMEYPATLGGWIAVVSGIALVASILGGAAVTLITRLIESKVDRRVHVEVPAVVTLAMREVNTKLDGIRINQLELSSEIAVVRRLEVKIDNGLATRVANIEGEITELRKAFTRQYEWDGDDRRNS